MARTKPLNGYGDSVPLGTFTAWRPTFRLEEGLMFNEHGLPCGTQLVCRQFLWKSCVPVCNVVVEKTQTKDYII